MGSELPEISLAAFRRRLEAPRGHVSRETDLDEVAARLHQHYLELRRWNPRLSLVGPGTAEEVVERHYNESLAALPALRTGSRLVDIGSGGGFPGWVLAAARPDLEVTLVESRQRKWAFLMSTTDACGLSCGCLNARVGAALPEEMPAEVDVVTARGVRLAADAVIALGRRLSAGGRWLAWVGAETPDLPGLREVSSIPLPGRSRRIAVLERAEGRNEEGAG